MNGKKICGILTELDAEMDRINYTIVGIGINVNNPIEKDLYDKANSIINIYQSKISKVSLLRLILKHFDNIYSKLLSRDYKYIIDQWFLNTNIIGKKVRLKGEKSEIDGIVADVDDTGCIILKSIDKEFRIVSGDLEFI